MVGDSSPIPKLLFPHSPIPPFPRSEANLLRYMVQAETDSLMLSTLVMSMMVPSTTVDMNIEAPIRALCTHTRGMEATEDAISCLQYTRRSNSTNN